MRKITNIVLVFMIMQAYPCYALNMSIRVPIETNQDRKNKLALSVAGDGIQSTEYYIVRYRKEDADYLRYKQEPFYWPFPFVFERIEKIENKEHLIKIFRALKNYFSKYEKNPSVSRYEIPDVKLKGFIKTLGEAENNAAILSDDSVEIIDNIIRELDFLEYKEFFLFRLLPDLLTTLKREEINSNQEKILQAMLKIGNSFNNKTKNPIWEHSKRILFYDWTIFYLWEQKGLLKLLSLESKKVCKKELNKINKIRPVDNSASSPFSYSDYDPSGWYSLNWGSMSDLSAFEAARQVLSANFTWPKDEEAFFKKFFGPHRKGLEFGPGNTSWLCSYVLLKYNANFVSLDRDFRAVRMITQQAMVESIRRNIIHGLPYNDEEFHYVFGVSFLPYVFAEYPRSKKTVAKELIRVTKLLGSHIYYFHQGLDVGDDFFDYLEDGDQNGRSFEVFMITSAEALRIKNPIFKIRASANYAVLVRTDNSLSYQGESVKDITERGMDALDILEKGIFDNVSERVKIRFMKALFGLCQSNRRYKTKVMAILKKSVNVLDESFSKAYASYLLRQLDNSNILDKIRGKTSKFFL
ncbi:MAG: hypothetical protein KKD11_06880 [Candidatus Omnitrophica bacterium]|nr:hypothetical protein [Candidatus Omnitrophota bacterium]